MTKFRVGDRAVCINDDDLDPDVNPKGRLPVEGKVYKILRVDNYFVYVADEQGEMLGYPDGYRRDRFRHASPLDLLMKIVE